MVSQSVLAALVPGNCRDCGVEPGQRHVVNCDVARCPVCGTQDFSCAAPEDEDDDDSPTICSTTGEKRPDGDMEVWSGIWPGVVEAEEYGWYSYFAPLEPGRRYRDWVTVDRDHPGAVHDLNRVGPMECTWDRERGRWVRKSPS